VAVDLDLANSTNHEWIGSFNGHMRFFSAACGVCTMLLFHLLVF